MRQILDAMPLHVICKRLVSVDLIMPLTDFAKNESVRDKTP
jgi:hypothetical protein